MKNNTRILDTATIKIFDAMDRIGLLQDFLNNFDESELDTLITDLDNLLDKYGIEIDEMGSL